MNLLSRKGAVVSASLAAILTAAGAGATTMAASADSTPLKVTLGQQSDGSATWDAAGNPVLTVGSDTPNTSAYATITPASSEVPASEPTFTTDHYNAGSPRWYMLLSNGAGLFSNQSGEGSGWEYNTGSGWQGYGDTYAQAVTAAEERDSTVTVSKVQIVADGDQAPGTSDTVTNVSYDGQTIGGGTVTFGTEATQHATKGTAYSLADQATTTSSDPNLTYAASGLPSGLQIDNTGTISGTPTESGQFAVTVHATDVYGDGSNYQHFVMDVASGVTYTQTVSARGPVKNANSGLCMDVPGGNYAAGTGLQQWACGAVYGGIKGADQNFQIVTLNGSDGSVKAYLEAIGPKGQVFYVSSANGGQLTLTTAKADMLKRGAYYTFPDDTRSTTDRPIVAAVDGASKTNGAKVIGWPKNTATYEQWTNP